MADSADSSDLEMFHHSVSWVIHVDLWFDLGVGWLLLTPGRLIGMFLCLSFHLMTTQMFSIGMFPYMSIALLTVWLLQIGRICSLQAPWVLLNTLTST